MRPGFLHTAPVNVATMDALLAERLPGVVPLHVVREDLLADAVRQGPDAVADRVAAELRDLEAQGAEVVCCTCSTIGAVAEQADTGFPVFRVDRPMAARAVRVGPRVGVVAALVSTLEPTSALLREEADAAGREIALTTVTADGAWARFQAGDQQGYDVEVAAAARRLAGDVDVVVLAQASMAGAEAQLADLGVPVLSSPRAAVEHLAALMADAKVG